MAHIEAHIEGKLCIFDLPEGFAFNLKKTNPLFTPVGSQTAPLELPLSPRNNLALGFPARIDGYFKPRTSIPVTIVDGIFRKRCMLRVSGAESDMVHGVIYFDEGEAYEKIKNVKLTELDLGGFKIPEGDINASVSYSNKVVEFLHKIFIDRETWMGYNIDNLDFDIFEILVKYGEDDEMFFNELKVVSNPLAAEYITESRKLPVKNENSESVEIDSGKNYGITPFLRVHALLRLIFESINYKLVRNPFKDNPQLSKLVMLNNTADTVVNGAINYKHIVPDCTVNDFLEALWTKFGAVLYLNSDTREAEIYFVKEILTKAPALDLTGKLSSRITRTFAVPKQLCLIPQTGMVGDVPFKSYQELLGDKESIAEFDGVNPHPEHLPETLSLRLLDGMYLQGRKFVAVTNSSGNLEYSGYGTVIRVNFAFSEHVDNVNLKFRVYAHYQSSDPRDGSSWYAAQEVLVTCDNFSGISGIAEGIFSLGSSYIDSFNYVEIWTKEVTPNPNGTHWYYFEGENVDISNMFAIISPAQMPWIPENKELENEELQAKDESYAIVNPYPKSDEKYEFCRIAPIYKTSLQHRNTLLKIGGVIKEEQSGNNQILFAFGMPCSSFNVRSGNFMPFNSNGRIAGWAFGLIYQGNFGLYKHFFEQYDQFLHHANESYECTMRLSKIEFMKLNIEDPFLVLGQPCLIETVTFPFGEDGDANVTLRSLRLMTDLE